MGTIVGFYTNDELYKKEAERLTRSAKKLGLEIELKEIESTGEWVKNASKKPSVLIEFRENIRGQLLYIDVDAYIHKNPWEILKDFNGDISCYTSPHNNELLSGTILINDTKDALKLLQEWNEACVAYPTLWDQRVLQDTLNDINNEATFQELPHGFCYIFDSEHKLTEDQIYIEHLQASRELKKKRKWTGFFTSRFYRRQKRVAQLDKT